MPICHVVWWLGSEKQVVRLYISTGNIKNEELETLLLRNLERIVEAFSIYGFIELDRTTLTFHM
jgi:predicted nuclease of predicted toxin-antitoxin system